jgi:hypothetical protein
MELTKVKRISKKLVIDAINFGINFLCTYAIVHVFIFLVGGIK